MIRWLRKKLGPPGPKELGWSKINALESRHISPHTKNKTWEDWYEYVKEHYPIKYRFKKIIDWFSQKKYNLGMRWYEFKSRYFKKQHFLDLRQGYNGYDLYEYGYLDPCEKILYASFNTLKEFVEREEPLRAEDYPDDEMSKHWKEAAAEIYDLYDYWMNRRAQADKKANALYDQMKSSQDEEKTSRLREEWRVARDSLEKEEQANLERLIKVREFMWT